LRRLVANARRAVVLTHSNADVDAVASAYGISYLLKHLGMDPERVKIFVPESIALEARDLASRCREATGIDIVAVRRSDTSLIVREAQSVDLCIVVDTASSTQLKMLSTFVESCRDLVVIDHHASGDLVKSARTRISIVDPERSSTSEIVAELMELHGVRPISIIATALLAGIVYDTKRFLRGSSRTFLLVSKLLEYGGDYGAALSIASSRQREPDSARPARIKCVLRHRGFRVRKCDAYIAISAVGAYESVCASMLLGMGYDIAIVLTDDEVLRATRIVFRAREQALDRCGIDVYRDILRKLVDAFGGGGGGHPTAGAVVVMNRDIDAVAKQLIDILTTMFGRDLVELVEKRVAV